MAAYRNRSEQLIYQRRAEQEKLATLQSKLRQEFHEKEFARWQNKGSEVQKTNELRKRLQEMRLASQQNLNTRRQQLAYLLEKQFTQHQQEIIGSQETPEQVRSRMAERVKQLKQERQNERKSYVNEQLYRRFQMNADELRKVDAELRELKTDYERNIQLIEKQNIMNNQYEEQMLFAELNKRELKKKEEQEKLKLQQQKGKIDERNAILAVQKEMKDAKIKKEKEQLEAEKQMLRTEWERDKEIQRQRELELAGKGKDIAKDLIQSNERQRLAKLEQARLEKEADKDLIARILEKEKELMELEKEKKLKDRDEARKTLMGFRNRNQDMAAYERELDRLIDEERRKKEQKQDEEWKKSEEARIKLLYDVYNDREKKVREHMKQREEELSQKLKDKVTVEESVKKQQEAEEERRAKELARNKVEQERLLEEIRAKQERRRQILLELQREENEINAARQDYEQKIMERKEKGKAELEMFKKTNRIF